MKQECLNENILNQELVTRYITNDQMYDDGDNIVWFLDIKGQTIYRGSLKTGIYEFVTHLPHNGEFRSNPKCIKKDEKLFCMPETGNVIWVYDINQNRFNKIAIPIQEAQTYIRMEFAGEYKNYLYFVGKGIKKIFQIDRNRLKINKTIPFFNDDEICGFEIAIVENKLYCTSQKSPRIFQFDITNEEIKYYELPLNEKGIGTICHDDEKFWLTGYDKKLYSWNLNNKIMEFGNFPKSYTIRIEKEDNYAPFYQSIVCEKNIWFIPNNRPLSKCSGIIVMNRQSHDICEFRLPDRDNTIHGAYTINYKTDKQYIGLSYWGDRFICEINTENFKIERKEMLFYKSNVEKMWKMNSMPLIEQENTDLQIFVDSYNKLKKEQDRHTLKYGKEIYDTCTIQ